MKYLQLDPMQSHAGKVKLYGTASDAQQVCATHKCRQVKCKHFLKLSWSSNGRRASTDAVIDLLVVEWTGSKLSSLISLSLQLMMTMQFGNCTGYWMDSMDLWIMKTTLHENYVNFRVMLKNRQYTKNWSYEDSSEWQQHYDSVSVFTCSKVCPTGRDTQQQSSGADMNSQLVK